jgi:broad specificity phosphatase PhoE
VIFVRHAESMWNSRFGPTRVDPGIADPALTETGRTQAMAARERFREIGVQRIVSSPYTRTLQTAEILRDGADIEITIDTRVGERRVFSCDVGTPASRLRGNWPGIDFGDLDEVWWNRRIESMAAFMARCDAFLEDAKKGAYPQSTLVVTHWGFIRAATGLAVGNTEFVNANLKSDVS